MMIYLNIILQKKRLILIVFGNTVYDIMSLADIITVSTETLRDFYIKRLNLPREKFIVIPNYLPRWWIGESYNIDKQLQQYKEHKKNKLTIGFCCSSNHFDIHNNNNGEDDFTHLIDWIIKNISKFNFVFVGGVPRQLISYVQRGLITYQQPSDIFNYPREMHRRSIDLLLAPLQDNEFNRCKSNIKFLEFAALGIPMAGQNISTYNKYTKLVFDNTNDIDNLCDKLFFNADSEEYYANVIKQQRDIIDNPSILSPNGFWLEKNFKQYFELFNISTKTVKLDINNIK